jgi:hypothetical protein
MRSSLRNIALIAALIVALVRPARAESLDTAAKQLYAGIAIVGAAAVIGVIFLVRHEKHKSEIITGCIASGSLIDDKDKRVYMLSGDPAGIKPGEHMTLKGRRRGNVFEAQSVIKDLGGCQP